MKRIMTLCLTLLIAGQALAAQGHSWEGIHRVPLSEAAKQFDTPPTRSPSTR